MGSGKKWQGMKEFARSVRVGRLKMLPLALEVSYICVIRLLQIDPCNTDWVAFGNVTIVEQTARMLSVACTNRNVLK